MRLKEAVEVRLGHPFRGRIEEAALSGIVAVQMKNSSADRGINWKECTPVAIESRRTPDWLQAGDILLATRGSRNYAVLVDVTLPEGITAVATPQFYVIRVKYPDLKPEYLHWWLNQAPCQKHFEKNSEGTLTKSLRRAVLLEAPLVVPTLEAQETVIKLASALRQQNKLISQQLDNNLALQKAIASDLLNKNDLTEGAIA